MMLQKEEGVCEIVRHLLYDIYLSEKIKLSPFLFCIYLNVSLASKLESFSLLNALLNTMKSNFTKRKLLFREMYNSNKTIMFQTIQ